jgi:hypothetical protein
LIVGAAISLRCGRAELSRDRSQPKRSAPSNTQSTMKPREVNDASTFHFPSKAELEP